MYQDQIQPVIESIRQHARYGQQCCISAVPSLTHWGRVTHICVGKLIIIGSDNGLSPDRRQAIIWTNAGLLSIGPLRTYFSENVIKMQQLSLKKIHVNMSSAKWRPSCLGLNVLTHWHPKIQVFQQTRRAQNFSKPFKKHHILLGVQINFPLMIHLIPTWYFESFLNAPPIWQYHQH